MCIQTHITYQLKNRDTTACSKEDLQLIANKLYKIKPADEHPFNTALFNAYVDKLQEIIYGKIKRKIFYLHVDWNNKTIQTNWDRNKSTTKIYNF